jgi:hypothetical protein
LRPILGIDGSERPGCRELARQVAELTRKLEEALRAGKRQAAPFRKGPPKPDPKTPGRKSGDPHGSHGHRPPPPDQVAECHEANLPDDCPSGAVHFPRQVIAKEWPCCGCSSSL